jgi:hypothetical protein
MARTNPILAAVLLWAAPLVSPAQDDDEFDDIDIGVVRAVGDVDELRAAAIEKEEAQRQAHRDAERGAFEAAQAKDSFVGWRDYLRAKPESPFRVEALEGMCELARARPSRMKDLGIIVAHYPDAFVVLTPSERLMQLGPEDMRLFEIMDTMNQGVSADVLAARLATSRSRYKVFDLDELKMLAEAGVPDSIVKAMIQSHNAAVQDETSAEATAERDRLQGELAALRQRMQQIDAESTTGPSQPARAATLAQCAGLTAAVEMCTNLAFPANTICEATARSRFRGCTR